MLIGYTTVRDDRDPLGTAFPTLLVNLEGSKTITIGSENSSFTNQLNQDIISLDNVFNLYLKSFNVTASYTYVESMDLNSGTSSVAYSNWRDEYAHRNAANSIPFQHQFDLQIQKEFKLKTGEVENRLQVSFDVINVGNLINSNWGHQYYASNQQISLIKYVGLYDSDPTSGVNYSSNLPTFNYTDAGLTKGKPYSTSDLLRVGEPRLE